MNNKLIWLIVIGAVLLFSGEKKTSSMSGLRHKRSLRGLGARWLEPDESTLEEYEHRIKNIRRDLSPTQEKQLLSFDAKGEFEYGATNLRETMRVLEEKGYLKDKDRKLWVTRKGVEYLEAHASDIMSDRFLAKEKYKKKEKEMPPDEARDMQRQLYKGSKAVEISKRKMIPESRGQMTLFGHKAINLHGLNFPKQSDSLPPILGWVGGKTKLADKIISMMPPHKVYVEPFLGGGSVFFKKPLADVNVINDLDKDLMNFYKGVRDGSCEKIRECKLPKTIKEFDKAVEKKSRDICSYLGVNKVSYGGNMRRLAYGKSSRDAVNFKSKCYRYKNRLSKQTEMTSKDYKDIVKEYDSKDTLMYLDPPYTGLIDTRVYKHNNINPEDVAKLVKSMKGKAIVSYNNHPKVRKAFKGLNFHKGDTRYELQRSNTGTHKNVSELIITNF